ncbi:MAG: CBS domain-containing protein [Candidatus Undinarchaeales archaeon]
MKLKSYVTPCPTVSPDDLVSKARAEMRKSNLRALPVLYNEKLVGVITRSDVLKITSSKTNIEVGGILWKPLIKIGASADILEAVDKIIKNKIKQLPVLENEEFIGMIRDVDMLKAASEGHMTPNNDEVKELMSKNVQTFSKKDPLSEVWAKITTHSGFPVVDNNKLIGIITSRELLNSKKARIVKESDNPNTLTKVETVMRIVSGQEDLFTVKKSDSVNEAAKKITKAGSNILIVKEKNKEADGILTKKDILRGYL